jgi:hypothetical protein
MADCVLFEAVKHIIADSLLTRARACDGRGTELWRRLHCEWQGSAPQLKHAKARKYQEPARCATVAGLWEALPEWERLGEEVRAAGLEMPEWMRRAALEKLVPTEMLTTLISRPELDTYSTRVHWVKAQMEHQRGSSQARAVTGHAAGRRDPGGDVVMQAVVAEESWSLQEQLESLSGAIQALAKGKGKGKDHGKGKGRGPHTGAAPGGAGGGKSAGKGRTGHFDGTCNHCGKYGHRKFECRTLDKEMADMKVKAGIGRGAPLAPGTLNEVGATDDGTWQWADDTAQELQDSAGAEWSLGIYAVRKDVPPSGISNAATVHRRKSVALDAGISRHSNAANASAGATPHYSCATTAAFDSRDKILIPGKDLRPPRASSADPHSMVHVAPLRRSAQYGARRRRPCPTT